MRIVVNGEERDMAIGTTVQELVAALNIKTRAVAVERNLQIVPAAEYARCILQSGDQLEIVTLVGGG